MRAFRDLSIRTKLTVLLVGVVTVALVLASVAFVINDVRSTQRSIADRHVTVADLLGSNSAAALAFFQPLDAEEVLSSLKHEPSIVFACVYDTEHTLFATYSLDNQHHTAPNDPRGTGAPYFSDGFVHVFREIKEYDETFGTIYLRGSLDDLYAKIRRNVFIVGVFLVASLAVSIFLASRLQAIISRPILRLAGVTETVSREADYSLRVQKESNDELGVLCDGFNSMLSQIQQRDRELEEHRAHLEELVAERTCDLEAKTKDLETSNRDLERSNQELDEFAYIASHDLKEPLRGISNYSSFLAEDYGDKLDDEGREMLATLKRLCARLEALIDSLLHYSRVGRAELAVQQTDLNELVTEVLDSVHVTLEERKVDVRVPQPLPTVTCDAVRVREVFRNLVTNAYKYNDKPEKWIEIGFLGDGQAGGMTGSSGPLPLVLYVRDNGIGIRENHLGSIFRIFKRLHGRDKFGGGTGAGLTFVKKIVERHGGKIWVESDLGEGTTFYFTLTATTPTA